MKHNKIATFPSSILHLLLKKVNNKVEGVPQAQVASNTKNTQDKDMSCKHKNIQVWNMHVLHMHVMTAHENTL